MEEKVAKYIVKKLNMVYPRTELETIQMQYGLEVFLDNLFKVICLFIISGFTGFLRESMLTLFSFACLRLSAGGVHFDKSIGCLLATSGVTLGGGYLAAFDIIPQSAVIGMFALDIILVFLYAPSGTNNNPIDPKFFSMMKLRSIITIVIYALLSVCVPSLNVGTVFSIGATCEVITILPIVNRKYKKIENT